MNAFLADVIWWFHLAVISFVLLAPLSNTPYILLLHFVFSISLIVHWTANSNSCSLTLLESKLRGVPVNQSFSYQFISPVYDISKTSWSNFVYFVTILTMSISFYKLAKSQSFSNFKDQLSFLEQQKKKSFKNYVIAFHSAFF